MKVFVLSLIFAAASTAAAGGLQKPVFSVFGKKSPFVEVTCRGLHGFPDGLTLLVPATGPDTYSKSYDYSEVSGLDILVSGKKAENTLSLTFWADEQETVKARTYSGLDTEIERGQVKISCELNAGDQISDL